MTKRHRSAVDGQYVTEQQAKADPARTVTETLTVKIDGQALREQLDLSVADILAHVSAINAVVTNLSRRVTALEESLGPLLRGE